MDVNRISGYIPGKMVFFLMQVGPQAQHALYTTQSRFDLS